MQKKKKEYEKPEVTRIRLDAKCAVLGFCKTTNIVGSGLPAAFGCDNSGSCDAIGS
jgi:hypothetical protein